MLLGHRGLLARGSLSHDRRGLLNLILDLVRGASFGPEFGLRFVRPEHGRLSLAVTVFRISIESGYIEISCRLALRAPLVGFKDGGVVGNIVGQARGLDFRLRRWRRLRSRRWSERFRLMRLGGEHRGRFPLGLD